MPFRGATPCASLPNAGSTSSSNRRWAAARTWGADPPSIRHTVEPRIAGVLDGRPLVRPWALHCIGLIRVWGFRLAHDGYRGFCEVGAVLLLMQDRLTPEALAHLSIDSSASTGRFRERGVRRGAGGDHTSRRVVLQDKGSGPIAGNVDVERRSGAHTEGRRFRLPTVHQESRVQIARVEHDTKGIVVELA